MDAAQAIIELSPDGMVLSANSNFAAAGAGENGKGFAVVASEVKALSRTLAA